MGGGKKSQLMRFTLQRNQQQQQEQGKKKVPKGCVAIKVGGVGEEQQRFVVPVTSLNHPLFVKLLKEAEEEYGFDQEGMITIPCHVEEFRDVQGMIDKDPSITVQRVGCFRVLPTLL